MTSPRVQVINKRSVPLTWITTNSISSQSEGSSSSPRESLRIQKTISRGRARSEDLVDPLKTSISSSNSSSEPKLQLCRTKRSETPNKWKDISSKCKLRNTTHMQMSRWLNPQISSTHRRLSSDSKLLELGQARRICFKT